MAEIDKSIAQIASAYVSAVHAKDVDAFMRLYDPAVRVFDTWGLWSYEGADAWRVGVEGWLTTLGSESVKVTFQDLKTTVTKDLAMASACVSYAAIAADGTELRSMQNRLSWVLRTSGHVLRIVHEHSSVPIGFEDTKGILKRP